MNYKGYFAKVEFDPIDRIFVGRIEGIRDIVSFHGESVTELETAFKETVEDYLSVIKTDIDARDDESAMLDRCCVVAQEGPQSARDQREANVFRLAAMVIQTRFPDESKKLMAASEQYFAQHPDDKLHGADVVKKGWINNMPRLRDMLSHSLGWDKKQSDVLLSDLPEDEREPFLQHLIDYGHTLPPRGPGDPPYNIRAYRCDYLAWKIGKPELG